MDVMMKAESFLKAYYSMQNNLLSYTHHLFQSYLKLNRRHTHGITSNRLVLSFSPALFLSHLHLSLSLSMSASFLSAATVIGAGYVGMRADPLEKLLPANRCSGWQKRAVANGYRTYCLKTWNPMSNKKFETFSYLPPLSKESVAKEVDYMISKGWVPCLEFDEVGEVHRTNCKIPGYYDSRYWTMWKLPLFGCVDSSQVFSEIDECRRTYPNAYIRLLSFDNKYQCQRMSFIIHKPSSS